MAPSQASDAQDLYDSRSSSYDDSWHPRFARHLVEIARPQDGEHVLDLACGTGLATFLVSEAVGSSGLVVAADISTGMLSEARRKQSRHRLQNVEFHQHSITDLDSLEALKGKEGTFDLITIASALVLLPEPENVVKEWVKWLKPGGRMVVDVTHVQSQIVGITFERVGKRLSVPVPFHRLNFSKPEDLEKVLEDAGLHRIELKALSQVTIEGTERLEDYIFPLNAPKLHQEYEIDDADPIFDNAIDGPAFKSLAAPETKPQAKKLFAEEWTKLADAEGKIQEYDCVYVGLGYKP